MNNNKHLIRFGLLFILLKKIYYETTEISSLKAD